jgi:tetratricopeptide (TPR) repeat protein
LNKSKSRLNALAQLAFAFHEDNGYSLHPILRSFGRQRDSFRFPGRFRVAFRQLYLAYIQAYQTAVPEALMALDRQRHNLLAATRDAYADERWRDVVTFVACLNSPEYPFLQELGTPHEEQETLALGILAADRANDKVSMADFRGNLAIRLSNAGRFKEAADRFRQAEALYTELGLVDQVALVHYYHAQAARQNNDLGAAERLYRSAISLAEGASSASKPEKLTAVIRIVSRVRGEAVANRIMHQLGMDRERHNVGMEDNAYEQLGLIAEARDDTNQAYEMFIEAASQSVLSKRPSHQVRNLGQAGRLALAMDNRPEAERLHKTGLRVLSGIGYPEEYSMGAESMAILADQLGSGEEALQLLRSGYDALSQFGGARRAEMAIALARYLAEQDQAAERSEAAALARGAIDFYIARGSAQAANAIAARNVLASALLADGDLAGGEEQLAAVELACREGDRPAGLLNAVQRLSMVTRDLGKLAEAARYHEECFELAEGLGEPDAMTEALVCGGEICIQQGAIAGASQALDRLAALRHAPSAVQHHRMLAMRAQLAAWRLLLGDAAALAAGLGSLAGKTEPATALAAADVSLFIARIRGDLDAQSHALADGDQAATALDDPYVHAARRVLHAGMELDAVRIDKASALLDEAAGSPSVIPLLRRSIDEIRADIDRFAGRWDAAVAAYAELEQGYQQGESVIGRLQISLYLGEIFLRAREPALAIARLAPAVQEALATGHMLCAVQARILLAAAYQESGEMPAARIQATQALAAANTSRSAVFRAKAHSVLARQAMRERRLRLASSHLAVLRRLTGTSGNPLDLAVVREIEGSLASELGDPDRARKHYLACFTILKDTGAVPEIVESLANLANISERLGDPGSAAGVL